MKPNRTFPAIPNDLREWTRYLSGLFYEREFEGTLVGGTTSPTGTCRYTVSAGIVCLSIPELIAVSNSINAFIDGLPDDITPEHDQQCLARIVNNSVTGTGLVQVGTDTGITLFRDLDATVGNFTAANNKGTKYSILVFPLD